MKRTRTNFQMSLFIFLLYIGLGTQKDKRTRFPPLLELVFS